MRIVDEAQERPLGCDRRQQVQHGQAHEKSIGRGSRADTERNAQRVTLRPREGIEVVQYRRAELMQAREGQLHLGLDAGGPLHPAVISGGREAVEQSGLPDAGLTAEHEGAALTRSHGRGKPGELPQLRLAATQAGQLLRRSTAVG